MSGVLKWKIRSIFNCWMDDMKLKWIKTTIKKNWMPPHSQFLKLILCENLRFTFCSQFLISFIPFVGWFSLLWHFTLFLFWHYSSFLKVEVLLYLINLTFTLFNKMIFSFFILRLCFTTFFWHFILFYLILYNY